MRIVLLLAPNPSGTDRNHSSKMPTGTKVSHPVDLICVTLLIRVSLCLAIRTIGQQVSRPLSSRCVVQKYSPVCLLLIDNSSQ